jgi:hypothetical protein
MEQIKIDQNNQSCNKDFLPIFRQYLVTDSFGYENFPEQRQLLQLTIEFYFPVELGWEETCRQLAIHRDKQTATYSREWLDSLLNFYALYLFWFKKISIYSLLSTKLFNISQLLIFIRKQILKNIEAQMTLVDEYFSRLLNDLHFQDVNITKLSSALNLTHDDLQKSKILDSALPELEPRSVIKFSESIRQTMSVKNIPVQRKFNWKWWEREFGFWQMFFLQVALLAIITLGLFWGIKVINHYYEKIIIEKITLLEPNFLWLDTQLTFKNESDIPQKEIKLSSTQIDELEKLERVEQTKLQVTEFLPESDILDTSVAIAGWGSAFAQDFPDTDAESSPNISNEYRDIYDGFSRSYRLMLNSADLFDMRQKLISLFRSYGVKEAAIPMVGKESLDGVYFNVFIPAEKIQNFIAEVGNIEITNTYISKTSYRPPPGYERVFIWVKKI